MTSTDKKRLKLLRELESQQPAYFQHQLIKTAERANEPVIEEESSQENDNDSDNQKEVIKVRREPVRERGLL